MSSRTLDSTDASSNGITAYTADASHHTQIGKWKWNKRNQFEPLAVEVIADCPLNASIEFSNANDSSHSDSFMMMILTWIRNDTSSHIEFHLIATLPHGEMQNCTIELHLFAFLLPPTSLRWMLRRQSVQLATRQTLSGLVLAQAHEQLINPLKHWMYITVRSMTPVVTIIDANWRTWNEADKGMARLELLQWFERRKAESQTNERTLSSRNSFKFKIVRHSPSTHAHIDPTSSQRALFVGAAQSPGAKNKRTTAENGVYIIILFSR